MNYSNSNNKNKSDNKTILDFNTYNNRKVEGTLQTIVES